MNLAVIPARGGSKRIPGKNIKDFCGKPIIAYSIEAALKSGVIDRVIVSTDDEAIAEVARTYGAETPFVRPAEISDDYTLTVPVIKHAIEWVMKNEGAVDNVCCIYATAPFVSSDDINKAYNKLIDEKIEGFVLTSTTFPFPIQRAYSINDDGYCEMFQPDEYYSRSQDLVEAYQDAAQFYWGSADAFLNDKIFSSTDSKPYVIPRHRVQDIDTSEDWTRAELMFKAYLT